LDEPPQLMSDVLSNSPSWFLRILIVLLIMGTLVAVRVESRITRLEEQDRMFAKTFENIDGSLNRIVVLMEQGASEIQVERENRIRLSAQVDSISERTERLSRLHGSE
jgi:hypothetical protein